MRVKQLLQTGFFAGVLFAIPALSQAETQRLDTIVAVVNKNVILQSEVDRLIHKIQVDAELQHQSLPDYTQLRHQVMQRLIDDSLLMQMAERQGMHISDMQLDQALGSIADSQHKTVAEMQAQAQQEGLTPAEFRDEVRKELMISEVRRNQLRQRINITDQEVKQLAKLVKDQGSQTQRFHIEHILVNLAPDASADEQQQAMAKANKIMAQLKHGGDFHEIAVAQSDDDQALNGGDWGWMTLEEMPSQMADVVKGAQEGQFIGPFRSGSGLHIIHIKELQGQAAATMMEVKARHILIKTSVILSDEKAKQTLNNLLNQIKTGSASFAELAKKYSDDTGSAQNGGELGWADPGMYAPEFRDQVSKLPVGQISQPFKTQFGWHIVEVEDRRNQANTSDALNNKAYQLIYNRRFAEEAQAWMDELRDEAYIKVLDGSSN